MDDGPTVFIDVDRPQPPEGHQHRRCKRCAYWYGAEDDEYGPCSLKTARGWERFLTFADWECDEGLTEPERNGGDDA